MTDSRATKMNIADFLTNTQTFKSPQKIVPLKQKEIQHSIAVTQTYLFDASTAAEQLEVLFGKYLVPTVPGVYVTGRSKPVMVSGQPYYRKEQKVENGVVKTIMHQINSFEEIYGAIYDVDGIAVILDSARQYVTKEPSMPIRGLKMVNAFVELLLNENSTWLHTWHQNTESIWRQYIAPEWQDSPNIYALMDDTLLPVKTELLAFIGYNGWIMHFSRLINSDILIEKGPDFRIHQWTIEHAHEYREK